MSLLSKSEVQFLQGNKQVSKSYEYKLKSILRKKLGNLLGQELPLLNSLFPNLVLTKIRKNQVMQQKSYDLTKFSKYQNISNSSLDLTKNSKITKACHPNTDSENKQMDYTGFSNQISPDKTSEPNHNQQLYIKDKEELTKYQIGAGGLAWLRYRLDMDNGNDLNIINKEFDKQTLPANQISTKNKESKKSQEKEVKWDNYKKYLLSRVSKTTASNLFRYAKQYHYILETKNASDLQLLTQEKRIHVMKALSSLSKFHGTHDEWKKLIEKFDLKWTNSNYTNNTFFKIFNPEAADMSKMIHWLKDTVRQLPNKYSNILLFATLTGLRPSECWHSIRLIQNNKDHYVSKDKLLHYQYPDTFLRRTKKVFISLVSEQIIRIAEEADIKKPYPQLCKIFRSKNLSMNMYYCRKIFATYLRDKGIEPEIIDLLQGRIPKSMFLRHYYRPDINEIITKRIRPVLEELYKEVMI